MATHPRFLVERAVGSRWQLVSHTGQYYPGVGACHPLVDGMTETDHAQICRAVAWMYDHPGVTLVSLTADAAYRVAWRERGHAPQRHGGHEDDSPRDPHLY